MGGRRVAVVVVVLVMEVVIVDVVVARIDIITKGEVIVVVDVAVVKPMEVVICLYFYIYTDDINIDV